MVFVRNDSGLIVVDGYSDNPSVKVGFKITETLVTPEDDPSLYDNAFGSSNYAAPGAHRLQITLTLVKYQFEQTPIRILFNSCLLRMELSRNK